MEQPWAGRQDFWRAALDSLHAHIAILDAKGKILAVNQAWRRFAFENGHHDRSACIGTNYLKVCEKATGETGEEGPQAGEGIRQVLAGARREFVLSYPCHSAVKQRWFRLRVTRFEGPGLARAVVAHENITAPNAARMRATRYAQELEAANAELRARADGLKRAEELEVGWCRILELIATNELLDKVLHEIALMAERQHPGVCCGIGLFRNGRLEMAAAPNIPAHLIARLESEAADVISHCEEPTPFLSNLTRSLSALRSQWERQDVQFAPIRTQPGRLVGCVAAWSMDGLSIPASHALNRAASIAAVAIDHASIHEKLSFQAHHDALTDLPNRLLFQDRLQQAFVRGRREGHQFAVMMIDLDRFKQINDFYGHRTGDALLRQIAHRITGCVREEDTVARLGGDEFVVIAEATDAARVAERIARNLSAALQRPFAISEQELTITCSVRVSVFPHDAAEAAALVRNADAALYDAKRHGRNAWMRYEPEMGMVSNERMEIERHLREALRNDEIELHYQPQLDLKRRVVGLEALMRWNNPVFGRVPPEKFIPIAEESGIIVGLGNWALRRACRQSVDWQKAGFRPVRMSVNVSTVQLCRPDFAEIVASVLAETGMPAELLELEVTESAIMHRLADAIGEMEKVRRIGVKISIDDFGTGYSSLSYIQTLPIDTVKIDRSFVQELGGRSQSATSVVRAIIALAHNLNLTVVAEGVETENQFEALSTLECDMTQGYLLHRPLTAENVELLFHGAESSLAQCSAAIIRNETVDSATITAGNSM